LWDNINFKEIPILNNVEINALYNIASYIIHSLQKNVTLCKKYICFVCKKETLEYDKLVRIRYFNKNILFFINQVTFNIFLKMEYIFQQQIKKQTNIAYNIKTQLEKLFTSNIQSNFMLY